LRCSTSRPGGIASESRKGWLRPMPVSIALPERIAAIETALRSGAMDPKEALAEVQDFQSSTPPPWRWKAWKAARETLIGSECAQCGSSDRLTLQHLKKRPGWTDLFARAARDNPDYRLRRQARRQQLRRTVAAIEVSEAPAAQQVCPRCGSRSIYFRKTVGTWRCRGPAEQGVCGHVFDAPTEELARSAAQVRRIASARRTAIRQIRAHEILDRESSLTRDAVLQWIGDLRAYLDFENVATFCNKCAFLWDKRGLALCPRCRTRYMPMELASCESCFGV